MSEVTTLTDFSSSVYVETTVSHISCYVSAVRQCFKYKSNLRARKYYKSRLMFWEPEFQELICAIKHLTFQLQQDATEDAYLITLWGWLHIAENCNR